MTIFRRARCPIVFIGSVVFLMLLRAQTNDASLDSPREIVTAFCKLDSDGKRLNSDGQRALAPLLLDARSVVQHSEITVTGDSSPREIGIRKDVAEFAVDYSVLGLLDSSLHFMRLQPPYSTQPVSRSEMISLIRSNTYFDLGSDGLWHQIKGTTEWRIKAFPSEPHVSVGAAIGYVRGLSFTSKDPVLKMNAQKTLAELESLYQSRVRPPQLQRPTPQSPATVLSQFITMETDGAGLTPEGLTRLNALSTQPLRWRQDKIHIAKAYSVREAPFSGNRAELSVEYVAVGELDSSLRFTRATPSGTVIREKFSLAFNNRYSQPASANSPAKEFIGPSRWQVEDAEREQWLTLDAAIRYLTGLQDATHDSVIKINAEKSLATLSAYR